jgi:hypothetical protein
MLHNFGDGDANRPRLLAYAAELETLSAELLASLQALLPFVDAYLAMVPPDAVSAVDRFKVEDARDAAARAQRRWFS